MLKAGSGAPYCTLHTQPLQNDAMKPFTHYGAPFFQAPSTVHGSGTIVASVGVRASVLVSAHLGTWQNQADTDFRQTTVTVGRAGK